MKRTFRNDSPRPWRPELDPATVTPKKALESMTGREDSTAEAARQRMLSRMGLTAEEDQSAAAARERMIQRQERRGR